MSSRRTLGGQQHRSAGPSATRLAPTRPGPPVRPVVLGGDIGAYSLARAFHAAYGVRMTVISAAATGPVRRSAVVDHVVVPGVEHPEVAVAALHRVAEEHRGAPLMVLGSADRGVRLLVENRHRLEDRYVVPHVGRDLLDRMTDEERFGALCTELGGRPRRRRRRPGLPRHRQGCQHHRVRQDLFPRQVQGLHRRRRHRARRPGRHLGPRRLPGPVSGTGPHPRRRLGDADPHLLQRRLGARALLLLRPRAAGGAHPRRHREPRSHHHRARPRGQRRCDPAAGARGVDRLRQLRRHGRPARRAPRLLRAQRPPGAQQPLRQRRRAQPCRALRPRAPAGPGAPAPRRARRDRPGAPVLDRALVPAAAPRRRPRLRAQVRALVRAGRAEDPLRYGPEHDPRRLAYVLAARLNQVRKFHAHHPVRRSPAAGPLAGSPGVPVGT